MSMSRSPERTEDPRWSRDDVIVFLAAMIPLVVAMLADVSDLWIWVFVGLVVVLVAWRLVRALWLSRR